MDQLTRENNGSTVRKEELSGKQTLKGWIEKLKNQGLTVHASRLIASKNDSRWHEE